MTSNRLRSASRAAVVVGVLSLMFRTTTATQLASGTVSETQAREWAAYAAGKAADDPKAFDEQFANLVRILAPTYRPGGVPGVALHDTDALRIMAIGPVSDFQLAASEAVRKLSPVGEVPWPCGVNIYVLPSQVDSPDIERIVVKRSGVVFDPIKNNLVSTPMTTRMGVTVTRHRGTVCFATSTFAPGAEVIVISIPVTGANITIPLTDANLRVLI